MYDVCAHAVPRRRPGERAPCIFSERPSLFRRVQTCDRVTFLCVFFLTRSKWVAPCACASNRDNPMRRFTSVLCVIKSRASRYLYGPVTLAEESDYELLRLGVTYEKSVTLGNVTMSHRTERPAECPCLSHSTMIGLPRAALEN
ncbi:hypothetical protein EVAR_31631_1 [Eumeta japonica]|uniref:Uncharacterized protein n=1 Tax=Eumeta variegata TaxID=151549 RepID=A0A4C1W238_EUMVA|nr:hypothetical protein EVAR_31631_1 [Eumeta japonica]